MATLLSTKTLCILIVSEFVTGVIERRHRLCVIDLVSCSQTVVVIFLNVALKLLEILLLLLVELSGSSLSFTKDNES
jgi:hypothetical protein